MASRCVDRSVDSDGDTYLLQLFSLFFCDSSPPNHYEPYPFLPIFSSVSIVLFCPFINQLPTKNDELHTPQLLVACSPLLALFYVIYTGFEDEEKEQAKRRQKGDFALDGHGE